MRTFPQLGQESASGTWKPCDVFEWCPTPWDGPVLATHAIESFTVRRSATVLVVLTLSLGQGALSLCLAWCDPQEAASAGCHDTADSAEFPRLIGGTRCDKTIPGGIVAVKEDIRRSAPGFDIDQAILPSGDPFGLSIANGRSADEPGHLPPPDRRPLVTALRI